MALRLGVVIRASLSEMRLRFAGLSSCVLLSKSVGSLTVRSSPIEPEGPARVERERGGGGKYSEAQYLPLWVWSILPRKSRGWINVVKSLHKQIIQALISRK